LLAAAAAVAAPAMGVMATDPLCIMGLVPFPSSALTRARSAATSATSTATVGRLAAGRRALAAVLDLLLAGRRLRAVFAILRQRPVAVLRAQPG
jgi:hypothetical protein